MLKMQVKKKRKKLKERMDMSMMKKKIIQVRKMKITSKKK
jgi:hypothetical protein